MSLRADLAANAHGETGLKAVAQNVPTVRFLAVALFRLAQLAGARVGLAGSLLKQAQPRADRRGHRV